MATSINNVQTAAASATLSYTPSSVSDSVLVVCIASEDVGNDEAITGITFGASGLTLGTISHSVNGSHANDTVIAYLVNPGTTTQTITVSGGQLDRLSIVAMTLGGIDQTAPLNVQDTSESNAAFVTSLSTSATTTEDNCLVISSRNHADDSTLTPTGCAQVAQQVVATTIAHAVGQSTQASAGTYTHTWVASSSQSRAAISSIAFNEAAAGATYTLTTASGTFPYAGASASLSVNRKITVGSGSYSYSGTDIDLSYTPVGGPTYTLETGSASYQYNGTPTGLLAHRAIPAESGSYSYQGTSMAFKLTRKLLAESGTYSYTGTSAAFKASRAIILTPGVFTYVGVDVKLSLPSELWQYPSNVATDWESTKDCTTSWADQPIMTTTWTKES